MQPQQPASTPQRPTNGYARNGDLTSEGTTGNYVGDPYATGTVPLRHHPQNSTAESASYRPSSVYSYTGSLPNLRHARSVQSIRTTASGVSVASTVKQMAYEEHKRGAQHEKLNALTLGPGRRMCRFGLICLIAAFLIFSTGLIVVILGVTQRILLQDQSEFIGPGLIAIGIILFGVACYLFVQANRRSTVTRQNIRFKAAGAFNVSAVNLAYEPDKTDLISGKAVPSATGNRTPAPSVVATPAPTTPTSTLNRDDGVPPTSAISGRSVGRFFPPAGAHVSYGSAAAHATRRQQFPREMPHFATPGPQLGQPTPQSYGDESYRQPDEPYEATRGEPGPVHTTEIDIQDSSQYEQAPEMAQMEAGPTFQYKQVEMPPPESTPVAVGAGTGERRFRKHAEYRPGAAAGPRGNVYHDSKESEL